IELPTPYNVKVNSSHFIHLLTWEPGPGTPREAYYNVSVCSAHGTSWEPVSGCEHVKQPLLCNLTEAFPDLEMAYYISVTAALGDQASQPAYQNDFVPLRDTDLDLPLLTVTPCDRDLCVSLHPPVEHLRKVYDSFHYNLSVKSSSFFETTSLKGEILKNVAPGRQYCVSVSLSKKNTVRAVSNFSQPQCVSTTGIHSADAQVSAGLCLFVVLILVILGLLVQTKYICLREPLPAVLTSIKHTEEMLVPSPCCTTSYSLIHIEPTLPSRGETDNNMSDDSDGEIDMGSTTGSRGGDYNLHAGINLSAPSSSCLSSPLCLEPARPPNSSPNSELNRLSVSEQQPQALISANIQLFAGSDCAQTTWTTSQPSVCGPEWDQSALGLRPHTDSCDTLVVEGTKPKEEEEKEEEEEEVKEGSGQGVNLLLLTFGGHEGEEEEKDKPGVEMSEVGTACHFERDESCFSTTPLLPSQPSHAQEAAIQMEATFADKKEDDEDEDDNFSAYLRR
uniref:Fibronectin type-III domain-containing protein n=1 Tax=Myripristis murdjan TaxID=586833 RepID=A0A667Z187_9TELE